MECRNILSNEDETTLEMASLILKRAAEAVAETSFTSDDTDRAEQLLNLSQLILEAVEDYTL